MRPLDDGLGLRPRHEDARSHQQFEVPEAGGTDDVLQGFAAFPSGQQSEELFAGAVAPAGEHQPATRDAQDVGRELFGVGPRAFHAGRRQPGSGRGEIAAE